MVQPQLIQCVFPYSVFSCTDSELSTICCIHQAYLGCLQSNKSSHEGREVILKCSKDNRRWNMYLSPYNWTPSLSCCLHTATFNILKHHLWYKICFGRSVPLKSWRTKKQSAVINLSCKSQITRGGSIAFYNFVLHSYRSRASQTVTQSQCLLFNLQDIKYLHNVRTKTIIIDLLPLNFLLLRAYHWQFLCVLYNRT